MGTDTTKKETDTTKRILLGSLGATAVTSLTGLGAVMLLFAAPSLTIRRLNLISVVPWQELSLYVICYVGAVITMGRIFTAEASVRQALLKENLQLAGDYSNSQAASRLSRKDIITERWSWLIGVLFLFLYSASTALCLRLHACLIDSDRLAMPGFAPEKLIGLALIVVAVALQIISVLSSFSIPAQGQKVTRFSSVFNLRHSILCAWLIFLTGFPLVYGVWMPLIALPGTYVTMMWWIRRQELALKEQFGQRFVDFQKQTWTLMPLFRRD
jgi:protein-S-isoprenylcysteine O-methyltransferase Ste14